ncbi:MAG: bifunctional diaminohydroxyphosphoribosylaminopyrimidine deaminase/5-amino-6-(5-phosphoribosylamino)uracil reductase RibD [bacterium]|nr:bifunctional diaminohydroxyphosphoribosylaminopyrimidine deaminase/5-amino-6-(5-phosphoribosylamino)uracil reductase RibD [bacterium]
MAPPQSKIDEYYMTCALELARNGRQCSPNPRVGCVAVRGGQIIGRGWHKICGGPHAEVEAVRDAGGDIEGADVYVTLEPCSHYGRTPPCADMLAERRPRRVIAGMTDPNPRVAGRGLEKLRAAGIEVKSGLLEKECRWMNRGFIRRMVQGRPWVTVKCAASLDGKVALANGESRWVTGAESRARVHLMRAANDAVLTGVGTVIADDPQLTVRDAPGRTPLRVILDRCLRTPPEAKILAGGAVIFTTAAAPPARASALAEAGARVETIAPGEAFLGEALKKLCALDVNYLMVEAGAGVTSAFMREGLCDELALFLAPKIMGRGLSYAEGLEFTRLADVRRLRETRYIKCGEDLLIRGVFECSPDL